MDTRHQAQRSDKSAETLIFRGILRDDLRFTPLGCHSTFVAPDPPVPKSGDYLIALHDDEKRLLLTRPVELTRPVVCANVSAGASLVEGRMPLVKNGRELRFLKGDYLIETVAIGDPPELRVEWSEKRADRKTKYPLLLHYSTPERDAYIKVLYQWEENRYLTAALTRPRKELEVSFGSLPGGDNCRMIVTYTSGMRTAVAVTGAFSVPLLQPTLRIARPGERTTFAPWHPITLEADVIDRQRGELDEEQVVWRLNGKVVGKGRLGCLETLTEGKYELEARLEFGEGITARRMFEVLRPKRVLGVPANDWD